jgi:hypothetical protein
VVHRILCEIDSFHLNLYFILHVDQTLPNFVLQELNLLKSNISIVIQVESSSLIAILTLEDELGEKTASSVTWLNPHSSAFASHVGEATLMSRVIVGLRIPTGDVDPSTIREMENTSFYTIVTILESGILKLPFGHTLIACVSLVGV